MQSFGNFKPSANVDLASIAAQYHPIAAILEKLMPFDEQESQDIAQIFSLMQEHKTIQPTLFERACEHAHFTASAFVANPRTKQALLHKHKKFGNWLQFGGHADGEQDLRAVALKEAEEESGLSDLVFVQELPFDISVHGISARDGIAEHLHLDIRYLLTTQTTEVPTPVDSQESQELAFFPFEHFSLAQDEKQARAQTDGPLRHDVWRMFEKVKILSTSD